MLLETENVTKAYGNVTAVNALSCRITSGELVGLVGSNGAGKSTFIKLLATLIRPTDGDIFLDGNSIVKHPAVMQKCIGYLPQDVPVYPNLNATEFLGYMAALKGITKKAAHTQISHLLDILHLADVGNRRLSDFSGGMRQRVGIACALLGNPQIIIVDEPTTGLDPEERVALRNILAELASDKIVLLSTHIITDIEAIANKIMVLKSGNLLFHDKPEVLIRKAEGHVWEYTISEQRALDKARGISSMVRTENGIKVRQVSDTKPASEAISVKANLEDACLHVLEGVSK